jgi:hypothetical protein
MKNYIFITLISVFMAINAELDHGVQCFGSGCPRPVKEGADTSRGYQLYHGHPADEQGYDVTHYPENKEYNASRGYYVEGGYDTLSSEKKIVNSPKEITEE